LLDNYLVIIISLYTTVINTGAAVATFLLQLALTHKQLLHIITITKQIITGIAVNLQIDV